MIGDTKLEKLLTGARDDIEGARKILEKWHAEWETGAASITDSTARRRANHAKTRERIEQAQTALRAELDARARGVTLPLSPLALGERYRIFRETAEATVKRLAPRATLVTDRLTGDDALAELSLDGLVISVTVRPALLNPEQTGEEAATGLCRRLCMALGEDAAQGQRR